MPETTTPAGATPAAAGATPAQTTPVSPASDPTPATATPATGDTDALGEAGKKAIAAERKAAKEALDALRAAQAELEALKAAGRDPEYEETAQVAQAEYTLATVQESHQQEIGQIDAALERLRTGAYGVCVDCGLEIPANRLLAVPFSLRCADCAAARELHVSRGATASP